MRSRASSQRALAARPAAWPDDGLPAPVTCRASSSAWAAAASGRTSVPAA
jgi:hypothetical protein